MTQTSTIRQSGGAEIICLPKAILRTLNLGIGSKLELTIENNQIVLNPVNDEPTLQALLAGSSKDLLTLGDEDREWLNAPAVGKEIL